MENKKTDIKTKNEDKVGIIPLSQIKGSDADSAHQDDVEELAKQAAKSDSDSDEQTAKGNTSQTDY